MSNGNAVLEKLEQLEEEYALFALQHLTLTNFNRENELDETRERIRLHFFFPALSEANREILLSVFFARRAAQSALNHPGLSENERHAHEATFMEFKDDVLSAPYFPSLTEVQRDFLNKHLFTIKFPKR